EIQRSRKPLQNPFVAFVEPQRLPEFTVGTVAAAQALGKAFELIKEISGSSGDDLQMDGFGNFIGCRRRTVGNQHQATERERDESVKPHDVHEGAIVARPSDELATDRSRRPRSALLGSSVIYLADDLMGFLILHWASSVCNWDDSVPANPPSLPILPAFVVFQAFHWTMKSARPVWPAA